ncbi:plasmid pRiA4b ORF-3 family protein [Lutibacter sp. A80]|uniref:plasmid pRiA4b ORF-3 family protein n=1 Tax=Lutibacter sp. A80 TaxID=2918453 RepID=UPI001F06D660|nr:plasmid pRiA4b ORF-3 family protein [Lutibacter sp. A80]UMB61005.1 plasmid pRiA4b ORF-3 family protein [Lutibacter sp. A80]
MAYKIRVILDVEQDVFRDIIVNETINLEELHFIIAKSFGFKGQEMASFYLTEATWEQGEEIPLFDMSEDENSFSMPNCITSMVLKKEGDKLIYIYDFFSMWTFFIELTEIINDIDKELPLIALSFGNTPDNAPEKEFIGEDADTDNFDAFDDENNFEDLDNIDFDNY